MLRTENLCLKKGKEKKPILQNLSLEFPLNCTTAILGRSGAGKSSLLRCLAQLEEGYEGKVLFDDKPLDSLTSMERANSVSYISQSYALFPHLSALRNCQQPLTVVRKMEKEVAREFALHTLDLLEMKSYANAYPHQLSGGQRQRVAIARALALNPRLVLFDEPTSALDPESIKGLIELISSLRKSGKGIVIATHDLDFAEALLDQVYYLQDGLATACKNCSEVIRKAGFGCSNARQIACSFCSSGAGGGSVVSLL